MTARNGRGSALIVLGYQWVYNGCNFLAFKVGGEAFHPLLLAALRFGIAAILILPVAAWRWRVHPAGARAQNPPATSVHCQVRQAEQIVPTTWMEATFSGRLQLPQWPLLVAIIRFVELRP